MGIFSEIDLDQQFPESSGASANITAASEKASAPQEPASFTSPFIGSMGQPSPFIGSAFGSAASAPQQPVQQTAVPASTPAADTSGENRSAPGSAVVVNAPQSAQCSSEQQPDDEKADESEEEKKKAHEEAEAKRKAEWEAKFAERRAKEQAERDRVAALSDDAVMMEAMKRVANGFERLTRRNMKDMVSEYVQTMCVNDPSFARNTMDPKKSMINCVKYINNKAREYIKQEMEDNDMKPEDGMYGGDVPDDVVYQWAVDYFNDPNAKEDEVKEEKFVPKPYSGRSAYAKSKNTGKKEKKKVEKKPDEKKPETKPAKKPAKKAAEDGQYSFLDGFGAAGDNAA